MDSKATFTWAKFGRFGKDWLGRLVSATEQALATSCDQPDSSSGASHRRTLRRGRLQRRRTSA